MFAAPHFSKCDPRRTKIVLLHDQLHVNGRPLQVRPPDRADPHMYHNGFYYETPDELAFAKLLSAQGIFAYHHPRFQLTLLDGSKGVWSPDFIFYRSCLLTVRNPDRQLLIHGIELKHHPPDLGTVERQRLLVDQQNVHVHILCKPAVQACIAAGAIPLEYYEQ